MWRGTSSAVAQSDARRVRRLDARRPSLDYLVARRLTRSLEVGLREDHAD